MSKEEITSILLLPQSALADRIRANSNRRRVLYTRRFFAVNGLIYYKLA